MDHFTIPEGTVHIRVPFRCTELYDGGDFFEYPARKGWTKDELLGRHGFGNRTAAEVEAFFQTWLYFGMLVSVFKLNGIEVRTEEFITTDEQSGQVIVTTAEALPRGLEEWMMNGINDKESKAVNRTIAILRRVATYIDRYCGVEGREIEGSRRAPTNAIPWPVAPEIAMSIIALGFVFTTAIRDIYQILIFEMGWGGSPLIKSKLLNAGWCPLDVRRIFSDFGIDGHYYLALAEFPHDISLHSGCNERACIARNVDEKTYVTPHLHTGTCQEDVATLEVVEIIKNGGIPVLSWVKDIGAGSSGFIVQDVRKSESPFVAISHVWADGLGNPKDNSLPVCQLERIQTRVDAVFPNGPHPVRFWMDTLCIPAAKKYNDLRKQSIPLMQEIYKRAFAVLVFDADLQQLSLSSTPHEKAIALYMSNWVHRLWTFQEGMFAKKLYFQLKDGVEDLTANTETANVEDSTSDGEEEEITIEFPHSAIVAITTHFVILKDFVKLKASGDPVMGNWLLLPDLAHALLQRTTTRMSDEAICAATILDLDVRKILGDSDPYREKTEEDLAAERMEVFLREMRSFNPGIVFHHQKRMKREGYRWAPATMMGVQPRDFSRDMQGSAGAFKGKGLSVQYPGFLLETVSADSQAEITVQVKQYNNRQFRVQIFPEAGEPLVWNPNAVYAVVTFKPLPSLRKDNTGTEAVVGILKDPGAVHDEQIKQRNRKNVVEKIRLRCEWRAWVEPLDEQTTNALAVEADILGVTQKWQLL
ncbi:Heterokaryon incompatibility [Mycena sanguinolenta]|uniref:Heterokaryon incompatibility n=1 Tax=Mycena sanguinolenta TaxID=230812 RepID=A0A8H6YH58_9AGAR|nr:Heterokaryon incompatibility [Mycena sanguinolenta]